MTPYRAFINQVEKEKITQQEDDLGTIVNNYQRKKKK